MTRQSVSTKYGNVSIFVPEFDTKTQNKVEALTKAIVKMSEKKKLNKAQTQNLLKQYSVLLLGLKLQKEKDPRGKKMAQNAIKAINNILK